MSKVRPLPGTRILVAEDEPLLVFDVYPVAHIVRDRGKGIVFVTAHPDLPELRKHWPHAKVLAKPVAEEDVIKAIAQACNPPTYAPS